MNNRSYSRLVICLFAFCLAMVIASFPVLAQSAEDFIGPLLPASTTPDPEADNSLGTILPQAETLKEEIVKAEEKVVGIKNLEQFSQDFVAMSARLVDLRAKLTEVKGSGTYGFEQIAAIRSQTRSLVDVINRLVKYVSDRLQKLESLRQVWAGKEITWSAHKTTFSANSGEAVRGVIKEAEDSISDFRKGMEGVEIPLVVFQKKVLDLQRDSQSFISEIDKLMEEMRKDLFRRSRPAMFTPAFLMQFDKAMWQEFWLGVASLELPDAKFFSSYGWIFFMQFVMIWVFLYLFRSLRSYNLEQLRLSFLLQRYISASILLGVFLPSLLLEESPRLIQLIVAALIAVSSARLFAGRIETIWRRRLIYLLVTTYLLTQFLTFIALPAAAFRAVIALIGLAGAVLCFWRARVNSLKANSLGFVVGVRLYGIVLVLVFLTQVAGYVALSNHLLDVSIKTIFLGVIAWMIDLILRGSIEVVFDNKLVKKSQIINKHYRVFINRAGLLIDILVVFFTFSSMLSVWGFADNTVQAAHRILDYGFAFRGNSVTIGLLVTAVALAYLAFFSSWLIQRVLDEEVYPRKKVERGVGISINRLIQYAFVVIAISLAFSTLGIGMQNLTVIIGAFGIGIGFGLQNIVNNFASGLILLFERSVKVGDVVQINGEWGTIKNLGLRATVVETFDHSEMIVPNSDLVSTMVTNWTLTDRQVRLIVPIGVAYGSDVDLVTKILFQIAQGHPFVMKIPEPAVLFTSFGASSLDFELRVWVADIDNRLKIKNEINREIDRLFRENAIEIPFAQHDLHIRSMDQPFKEALQSLANQESVKKQS